MLEEKFEKQRKEDNKKLIEDTFKAEIKENKSGFKLTLYYFVGAIIASIIVDLITERIDMPYIAELLAYAVIFTVLVYLEMFVVSLIRKKWNG